MEVPCRVADAKGDVDVAKIAEARGKTYWLLSETFRRPPDDADRDRFLAGLRAMRDSAIGSSRAALERMCLGIERARGEALAREHTRLFGGLRADYGPPPPYESLHREARLMGECTVAVAHAYAAAGYETIDAGAGPQDHLGTELRFMAFRCVDEAVARRAGDPSNVAAILAGERDFLERHLLAWVPRYCDRLERETREPFYAGLAGLTREVLNDDIELVRELPAHVAPAG